MVAISVSVVFAIRGYQEAQAQQEINKRLEATNASSQSAIKGHLQALQDVEKQKTDIESSLKVKEQESAEKQQRIETLESQLQAKAKASLAKAPVSPPVTTYTSGTVWDRLAQCESGGNWAINTGNGFYGGLQFDIGTWGGYKGYANASLAPASVQIEKAMEVHARRGFSPWPACKMKLGL